MINCINCIVQLYCINDLGGFGNSVLWCDITVSYPRPYVPRSCRREIFDMYHNLSHPGINYSVKLIKARFFWPDMDKNIRNWCRECESCQEVKIHRHTKSKIETFSLPSERLQNVNIDIVGPLPQVTSNGSINCSPMKYLLTMIDRSTKWIEAEPISDISALTVATAFLRCWVTRYGVPLHIITDRGKQFESELFQELARLVGFNRLRTTSYHPQTNGLVERMHRCLKTSIMARKQSWLDALPVVLMSLRNMPTVNGYAPFTALTGSQFLFPRVITDDDDTKFDDNKLETLIDEMKKIDLTPPDKHNNNRKSYIPKDLKSCPYVWVRVDRVRRPLEAPYTGPFPVKERFPKFYVIELRPGKEETVSIERLKPAVMGRKAEAPNLIPPPVVETDCAPPIDDNINKQPFVTRYGRKVRFRI